MDRLKGIGTFFFFALGLWFALRVVHLGIPIFYPKVLTGPFSLESIEAAQSYLDFSPRMPFYRPEELGARPVNITVTRRPYSRLVVFWSARHFLQLTEQQGGPAPSDGAGGQPLPGHPDATWWNEGQTHHVVMKLDDLWIEVRTDLSLQDVQRLVDTLRPYKKLL